MFTITGPQFSTNAVYTTAFNLSRTMINIYKKMDNWTSDFSDSMYAMHGEGLRNSYGKKIWKWISGQYTVTGTRESYLLIYQYLTREYICDERAGFSQQALDSHGVNTTSEGIVVYNGWLFWRCTISAGQTVQPSTSQTGAHHLVPK